MVAVFQLQIASGVYWSSVTQALYTQDVWMGLIKPFVLGFVIVTIALPRRAADQGRHAGRRRGDDRGGGDRVGGGDRRRLLRDQDSDRD